MEKFWIKKELYILNYEFLKFYVFFPIFIWYINLIFIQKFSKRGVTYLQALTWRAGPGGSWCGAQDRLEVRHGTEATWQSPDGPHGAQWCWRMAGGHTDGPTRTRQLPTIFGPILPLKSHVFLLCSSNFDRLVKKLSEFPGRSLVHRDPPAFRLDCKAIGAGLIVKFSLISSNFPLEFQTSTRKNPSKFASIHKNWSPILAAIGLVVRFDWLSGSNLSFY